MWRFQLLQPHWDVAGHVFNVPVIRWKNPRRTISCPQGSDQICSAHVWRTHFHHNRRNSLKDEDARCTKKAVCDLTKGSKSSFDPCRLSFGTEFGQFFPLSHPTTHTNSNWWTWCLPWESSFSALSVPNPSTWNEGNNNWTHKSSAQKSADEDGLTLPKNKPLAFHLLVMQVLLLLIFRCEQKITPSLSPNPLRVNNTNVSVREIVKTRSGFVLLKQHLVVLVLFAKQYPTAIYCSHEGHNVHWLFFFFFCIWQMFCTFMRRNSFRHH